jgi:Mg-chelatase subunit ChlD
MRSSVWGVWLVVAACALVGCGDTYHYHGYAGEGASDDRDGAMGAGNRADSGSGDDSSTSADASSRADGSEPARDASQLDSGANDTPCDAGPCPDAGSSSECRSEPVAADIDAAEVTAGNVLFVHDRSASMANDWNGAARWEVLGDAVQAAVSAHASALTVGTLFFPSSDPNAPSVCIDPTGVACILTPGLVVQGGTCAVNEIAEPDQIDLTDRDAFLAKFSAAASTAPIYAPIPTSFTPLKEALLQAQAALDGVTSSATTTVIILTDGDPNCEWDVTVAEQIVGDWSAAGIATHVIGLPTTAGSAVLGSLATAAQTTAVFPTDAGMLQDVLDGLLQGLGGGAITSCTITLDDAQPDVDELHLIATYSGDAYDVPRHVGSGDGWTLSSDGSVVTLDGALCSAAQSGRLTGLRFERGCVELPTLDAL